MPVDFQQQWNVQLKKKWNFLFTYILLFLSLTHIINISEPNLSSFFIALMHTIRHDEKSKKN